MSVSEPEKEKTKIQQKYDILVDRLKEENPKVEKEVRAFFREIEKTWKKISPFIGEEEAYAKLMLRLAEDFEIRGAPLSFILFYVLFKKISEKLDRELKWFKDNKEIIEMMVKEYVESSKFK